jgi:adenine-specific DNA-methyltransferase
MANKKTDKVVPIDAVKHKDKRSNIPTEELRGFVKEDELKPKQVKYPGLLYARDPSLDPQLVWKGKDRQDTEDLTVPSVPVYIQEKIHPQAIIEDVRAQAKKDKPPEQLNLFADFNGIEFEQMIEFYQHDANWSNRMILGDSLLVMTSLAEKERLKGKVQMIYIDPPYGIKFGSNWQVSTRKCDVKDGKVEDATRQPEQIRAFRDTWELGIHSYLSYWRDRLIVARELLTETGSIFAQISDENVHHVRELMDEVFGSNNFICLISFRTASTKPTILLSGVADFIVWYGKDIGKIKYRELYKEKREFSPEDYETQPLEASVLQTRYPVKYQDKIFDPKNGWRVSETTMQKLVTLGRIEVVGKSLRYKKFSSDFAFIKMNSLWSDLWAEQNKIYAVQTNANVIGRCLLMTTDPGDLVLDPTCGSGTTAFVAEQWGRRWITIDTSRVALALARTRLMTARFPYYILADSPDGVKKEAEITGQTPPPYKTAGDMKKGFVYQRVPHVTLKSIANNPDMKEGMSREEIERAIARHADTELLYDKPYVDNKRIRVTGPLTVESLSPHRTISVEEKKELAEVGKEGWTMKMVGAAQFGNIIIENLKKAGVQNTIKNERLKFDRLEVHAGVWIHAEGEYTEKDGKSRRVGVCIGPEHGTVGPELVKEAAKEAVRGIGYDLLLVCGFAFDPHVSEEAKRYGSLTVLPTRINADLQMGDEFLKKTGAANLFMVFGEPDIEISKTKDSKIEVEVKGLDIYDPTTGQIRNNSTDDIACWFIDTNYNGESFFVRHAYFTGAGEPYDKLKRALRAEISEEAWSMLYSTKSRPFDPPETGKIAVKVINHYGDEVLKVYETR